MDCACALTSLASREQLCGLPDEIWLKILSFFVTKTPFPYGFSHTKLLMLGRVCKKMNLLTTATCAMPRGGNVQLEYLTRRVCEALIGRCTMLKKLEVYGIDYEPGRFLCQRALEMRGNILQELTYVLQFLPQQWPRDL